MCNDALSSVLATLFLAWEAGDRRTTSRLSCLLLSFAAGTQSELSKPRQQRLNLAGRCLQVYQWDMDSGDLVQEYDYHLAAVNTITFVDEGRRFVTTSDDKTIRQVLGLTLLLQSNLLGEDGEGIYG